MFPGVEGWAAVTIRYVQPRGTPSCCEGPGVSPLENLWKLRC